MATSSDGASFVNESGMDVVARERMRQLYQEHAKPLHQFLLRLTFGDRQVAEDLLQETLLRAWRKRDVLPTDPEAVRPWLFTVARRIAIDAARARRVRPTEVGGTDLTAVAGEDDAIERLLATQLIRQAMTNLSAEHRAVLVEIYYHDRTAGETAAELGIPEGTVKSRVHHALRKLRNLIGPGKVAG